MVDMGEHLNAIWEFVIPLADEFKIVMPHGSVPLRVGFLYGRATLWAAVDAMTHEPREERLFFLRQTGDLFPTGFTLRYVGSFEIPETVKSRIPRPRRPHNWDNLAHLFDGGVVKEDE